MLELCGVLLTRYFLSLVDAAVRDVTLLGGLFHACHKAQECDLRVLEQSFADGFELRLQPTGWY